MGLSQEEIWERIFATLPTNNRDLIARHLKEHECNSGPTFDPTLEKERYAFSIGKLRIIPAVSFWRPDVGRLAEPIEIAKAIVENLEVSIYMKKGKKWEEITIRQNNDLRKYLNGKETVALLTEYLKDVGYAIGLKSLSCVYLHGRALRNISIIRIEEDVFWWGFDYIAFASWANKFVYIP